MGIYDPVAGTPEMGYLTGIYRIGCGSRTLSTTLSRETKKIKESCSGQRLDLMELETGKSLEIKLELTEFDRRTLAAAFLGKDIIVAAGSVTDEALPTGLQEGETIFLKYPKAKNISLQDSNSTTPLTLQEGVHWRADSAAHGCILIRSLPAGIVHPLRISYDYGQYANIAAFGAQLVQRGIIFTGTNQSGQHARVCLPRLSLGIDGDFAWLSEEDSPLSLSGSALYVPELAQNTLWGGFMRIDALPV